MIVQNFIFSDFFQFFMNILSINNEKTMNQLSKILYTIAKMFARHWIIVIKWNISLICVILVIIYIILFVYYFCIEFYVFKIIS